MSRHHPYNGRTLAQDIASNSADHDLLISRSKVPRKIHVETAVFVDKDLALHMENYFPGDAEEQLVQVVLAMVNAVSLLTSKLQTRKSNC